MKNKTLIPKDKIAKVKKETSFVITSNKSDDFLLIQLTSNLQLTTN